MEFIFIYMFLTSPSSMVDSDLSLFLDVGKANKKKPKPKAKSSRVPFPLLNLIRSLGGIWFEWRIKMKTDVVIWAKEWGVCMKREWWTVHLIHFETRFRLCCCFGCTRTRSEASENEIKIIIIVAFIMWWYVVCCIENEKKDWIITKYIYI